MASSPAVATADVERAALMASFALSCATPLRGRVFSACRPGHKSYVTQVVCPVMAWCMRLETRHVLPCGVPYSASKRYHEWSKSTTLNFVGVYVHCTGLCEHGGVCGRNGV